MPRRFLYQRFLPFITLGVLCLLASMTVRAAALPEFTELIENNAPAVVKITTSKSLTSGRATPFENYNDLPEPWRHLFPAPNPREREARSMGSGFIIEPDGYVL